MEVLGDGRKFKSVVMQLHGLRAITPIQPDGPGANFKTIESNDSVATLPWCSTAATCIPKQSACSRSTATRTISSKNWPLAADADFWACSCSCFASLGM